MFKTKIRVGMKKTFEINSSDSMGTVVLISNGPSGPCGVATVYTSSVRKDSVIMLSRNTPKGFCGDLSSTSSEIVEGSHFIIRSDNVDSSSVNWQVLNNL